MRRRRRRSCSGVGRFCCCLGIRIIRFIFSINGLNVNCLWTYGSWSIPHYSRDGPAVCFTTAVAVAAVALIYHFLFVYINIKYINGQVSVGVFLFLLFCVCVWRCDGRDALMFLFVQALSYSFFGSKYRSLCYSLSLGPWIFYCDIY